MQRDGKRRLEYRMQVKAGREKRKNPLALLLNPALRL
jgi:hypothetical protein